MKLTREFRKAYKHAVWTLTAAVVISAATFGILSASNKNVVKASSAADCGATSIINCGASTSAQLVQKYNANATGDLPRVYGAFGITSQMVQSLSTKVALGQVHRDGTVWLNGKQIGSGAYTAGRVNFAGSYPLKDQSGTTVPNVYMRTPSVSFAVDSIDAYIGFVDGKPSFAVLSACGNPVTWPMPNIEFSKKVSTSDYKSWVKDATYTDGATVQYLLTVKNIGQAAATNVIVYDKLPANQTYVAGSTKVNSAANIDGVTSTGVNLGTVAANSVYYISFKAKIAVPADKCGTFDMRNIAHEDNDQQGWREDSATTHVTKDCPKPQPKTVKCESLSGPTSIKLGESATYTVTTSDDSLVQGYGYTLNGSAVNGNGKSVTVKPTAAGTYTIAATITPKTDVSNGDSANCVKTLKVTEDEKPQPKVVKCESLSGPDQIKLGETATYTAHASDASLVANYTFSVSGGSSTTNSGNTYSLTPATAGVYTISAKVNPIAGVNDGGSANCVKTLKVTELPKPVYRCDALAVSPSSIMVGGSVKAIASYTVQNGATFKRAVFNFGDGNTQEVTDSNNVAANHTYNTSGTYNVTVDMDFTVNGQTVTVRANDACSKKITVNEKPVVVAKCDALTANKTSIKLGETVAFSASATALNTTVSQVVFKVNGQVMQTGSSMSYSFKPAAKGDYIVSVSMTFANGAVAGDDTNCSKKITVTQDEVVLTPVYTCDAFDAVPGAIKVGDKVRVTIKFTAANGAVFEKAVVDFGESTMTVNKNQVTNNTIVVEYTYKNAKDYTLKGMLTFMVNGQAVEVSGAHCGANVKVTTTPPVTPPEKCKIPGKEQYNADDKVNCVEVLGKTTTELPATGAGGLAGAFVGITAAGAVVHNILARRSVGRQ